MDANNMIDKLAEGTAISAMIKILFNKGSFSSVLSSSTVMDGAKYAVGSVAYQMVGRPIVKQITGVVNKA